MPRTRTKPIKTISVGLPSGQQSTTTGAWSTGGPSVPFTVSMETFEMTDTVTPGFRRKSAQGGIVNSPMSSVRWQFAADIGATRVLNSAAKTRLFRSAVAFARPLSELQPSPVVLLAQEVATEAYTSARSRVASPEAMGMVSWGERAETLNLLRKPVLALVNRTESLEALIKKAKRLKASRPEIVSIISNWWLLYRYGIMPLISEVEGVIKAFQAESGPRRETARGSASALHAISGARAPVSPGWGLTETETWEEVWDISSRAGCLYAYESTLTTRLGLDAGNIPRSAYDLVTLSFVLDWFVNVGDYLGALTADLRGDILASWITTDVTCTRVARCQTTFANPSGYSYLAEALGVGYCSTTTVWRSRVPAGIGQIGVVPRVRMNTKRYADAFALIYTRLSGRVK